MTRSTRRILLLCVLLTPIVVVFLSLLATPRARELHSDPGYRMANNLRAIAKSCILYSADNNDHFPPYLTLLLLEGAVSPKQLCDTNLNPLPLPNPLPLEAYWPTLAADLERKSAYIYTAADLTNTMDPALIIAYTKPSPLIRGRRIIAFADNHVDFIPDSALPAAFAASNAARAKLGLPPFTLDGPPPAPPK